MFAVFGEIIFEVINSPQAIESFRSWKYAEHRVLEGRPRLQWVSDPLERIVLEMMFHASFTDPAAQMSALFAAASDHQARALILGTGEHLGYFVVTSLSTVSRQMTAKGNIVALTARVVLKEWVIGAELSLQAQSIAQAIGTVAAPAGAATEPLAYSPPLGVSESANAGAAAYLPPSLAWPGVSPILSNPQSGAAFGIQTAASDIPPSQIVRTHS
jgi:phage protein U